MSFQSFSQNLSIGLKGGMIYPMYSLHLTHQNNDVQYEVKNSINYSYGVSIGYKILKNISISIEPCFEKHIVGWDVFIYRAKPYELLIQNTLKYDYLDIPLMVRYYYKNTGIFFNIGASAFLRLNSNVKTTSPSGQIIGPESSNYNENSTFLNYGGIVGIGYTVKLNKKFNLSFELRDRQIFNNQFTPYGIERNLDISSNTLSLMSMFRMNL